MRTLAFGLIAALAFSSMAYAQSSNTNTDLSAKGPVAGDWEGTLSGNGTSNNNFDNHQFGLSGSVGKYMTDHVLLGLRQSVNFSDVEAGDDLTNFSTRAFADYVFDLGSWRPFVGINFGGIYGENVNNTFAAGPEVGVKYYADQKTFVYLQGEYQFTFDSAADAGDAADDGQYYYTVGVGVNF